MQINRPHSIDSTSDRFTLLKLLPFVTLAWLRRIVEDPLMIVLLVWAFLFVTLLLINVFV